MSSKIRWVLGASLVCMACSWLLWAADSPKQNTPFIQLGDPLGQAKANLEAAKVTFSTWSSSFARVPDKGNLYCVIDENKVSASISYSKSRQVVTGIALAYRPEKQAGKSSETWLAARSISFEPDGSYRVHFLPPARDTAVPSTEHSLGTARFGDLSVSCMLEESGSSLTVHLCTGRRNRPPLPVLTCDDFQVVLQCQDGNVIKPTKPLPRLLVREAGSYARSGFIDVEFNRPSSPVTHVIVEYAKHRHEFSFD